MNDIGEMEKQFASVLVSYTHWVIEEARKRNIQRLYFLARDSWLMYNIAEELCKKEGIDIECSYFYCSRYALRAGAYRFFDDSAFEKLFIHSYRQNAQILLRRAGLNYDRRKEVYKDLGFNDYNESLVMGRKEFGSFCDKLRLSKVFRKILREISNEAYPKIMGYIRQEGMNLHKQIGIVDLGWSGSLHYTLRRLLDSEHIKTGITGFYMGLLEKPPIAKNSVYVPWLFDFDEVAVKSWFSHNLMECICTAPQGMTLGYANIDGIYGPVLADNENLSEHITEMEKICTEIVKSEDSNLKSKERVLRILHKLMCSPSRKETEMLKEFDFCDDVAEQYHKPLVEEGSLKDFMREILPFKLLHGDETDGFYWYFGSLKNSKICGKWLFRAGYILTRRMIWKYKSSKRK